jgi:hypothetical protein
VSDVTLEQIREKYEDANYAPDPNCKKCKGAGEWYDDREFEFFESGYRPCICIYVEHEFAPDMAKMISEFAKRELEKLRSERH